MKKSQPPFLAQLPLALLTHPRTLAPSFSFGSSVTSFTSSRSPANAGVYSAAILLLAVDATGVEISGSAEPALSRQPSAVAFGIDVTFLHIQATCGL